MGRPPPQWLRVHKLTFHTSQEQAGLASERSRVSAARGPTGTPISTSSAPLPAPGAWTRRPPFQLHVNDPTHLLCRHRRAPEAKRTRRLLIWARQLRLPRDPRFGSREGIKKKKRAGEKTENMQEIPMSVKGYFNPRNAEVEKQQHLFMF